MLVRGLAPSSVLDDESVAQFREHRPDGIVEEVEGAGHSIQGDQPVVLAQLVGQFLDTAGV